MFNVRNIIFKCPSVIGIIFRAMFVPLPSEIRTSDPQTSEEIEIIRVQR